MLWRYCSLAQSYWYYVTACSQRNKLYNHVICVLCLRLIIFLLDWFGYFRKQHSTNYVEQLHNSFRQIKKKTGHVRLQVITTSDHENDTFCMEILINTLRLRQNGWHVPDNIFKCIFFNKNVPVSLTILLKFYPNVQINNISALVQMIAWCQPGNKPLSEPMMFSLLTYISVTLPQWVMAYSACMGTTMTRQHWIDLHNAKSYQWMTHNGLFTSIIYHLCLLVCHINHITECVEFNFISIEIVHRWYWIYRIIITKSSYVILKSVKIINM